MEKIILTVVFGLAWGSFLNVVIYRLPRGASIVRPPSSCPRCGRRIRASENIPLLSYVLLRGRCRGCGFQIPLTYPLVEALTPLVLVMLVLKFGLSHMFFASAFFASAMIVLAFIDLEHQILPDEITLPGLLLAAVYSLFRPDLNLRQALIGALTGAGFLLLVYAAYFLLRRKEGLGMGDVTLMLFIGAFLGLRLTLLTLILASLLGALAGVFFIVFRKRDMQYALPFGTFLAPAALFSLLWGEAVVQAYLGLYKNI